MKTAVYLGKGNTFNVSEYKGYESFTKDNFLLISNSSTSLAYNVYQNNLQCVYGTATFGLPDVTYDCNNGIFSCSNYSLKINGAWYNIGNTAGALTSSGPTYVIPDVYLIY